MAVSTKDRFSSKYSFHLKALVSRFTEVPKLNDLDAFCLFIGYPRSGHSLIGSLLDAHPEAIISHELDILWYLKKGYPKNHLLGLILAQSRRFQRMGNAWTGYSYNVEGQYQGRYTQLKLIGDKKGGSTTQQLTAQVDLMNQLRAKINMPMKMVHIVRNPFDNITTRLLKHEPEIDKQTIPEERFQFWIERFFADVETNANLIKQFPEEIITQHLDDYIQSPQQALSQLLAFLTLSQPADYLEACSALISPSPSLTRQKINWPLAMQETVLNRSAAYDFLSSYRFQT